MADTFTSSKGYAADLSFSASKINVRGELRCGVNRGRIEITCISDGIVPFRSYTVGLYDQMEFTVPVAWDPANDGVAACLVSSIAGTTDALIIKDAVAGNTLLSGQALVNYEYAASLDDIQLMNVTFTFTGALTGNLVA